MTYSVCSSQIISERLHESHTVEKFDFLKSMIHSQIMYFPVDSK